METGLIDGVTTIASPNYAPRSQGSSIDCVIIHGISLPPGAFGGDAVAQLFCNELDPNAHPYFAKIASLEVSSHLFIRRDGSLIQFVPFHQCAYHAGKSQLQGRSDCNDFSIGIELEGTDTIAYTDDQYIILSQISSALMRCFPFITPDRIVGHCDVAPGRKTDPGATFNWGKFFVLLKQAKECQ